MSTVTKVNINTLPNQYFISFTYGWKAVEIDTFYKGAVKWIWYLQSVQIVDAHADVQEFTVNTQNCWYWNLLVRIQGFFSSSFQSQFSRISFPKASITAGWIEVEWDKKYAWQLNTWESNSRPLHLGSVALTAQPCALTSIYILTLKVLNFWKFTSYCSLKPLWSGVGEVVPARTSPTLHPHPLPLCINCDYHFKS